MLNNKVITHVVRRPYDVNVSVFEPVGDSVETEYRLIRDSHGNCEYVEVGEKNIREYVNSFKNGCSLKSILDRCQLMPVRDKIAYLNQSDDGLSADVSSMPKDGTEAQIMLSKIKAVCPDFASRLKNGESFEKIVSEFISGAEKAPVIEDTPVESKTESEVV